MENIEKIRTNKESKIKNFKIYPPLATLALAVATAGTCLTLSHLECYHTEEVCLITKLENFINTDSEIPYGVSHHQMKQIEKENAHLKDTSIKQSWGTVYQVDEIDAEKDFNEEGDIYYIVPDGYVLEGIKGRKYTEDGVGITIDYYIDVVKEMVDEEGNTRYYVPEGYTLEGKFAYDNNGNKYPRKCYTKYLKFKD